MKNILFFGGGNIAQALISGLLLNGMSNKNIFFVDRNPLNQKKLNTDLEIIFIYLNQKIQT